jgi:hypothetical protein
LFPPASSSDESYEDEVNVVIVEEEVIFGPPKRRTTQGSALRNSTNKRKKTKVEKSTMTRMNELPDGLDEMDFDNVDDWNDYASSMQSKNDLHREQLMAKSAELKSVRAQVALAKHTNNSE